LPGLNGEPGTRGPVGFPGVKGAAGIPGRNPEASRVSAESRVAQWPDVLLLLFCIMRETKALKSRRAIWAKLSLA